MIKVLVLLRGRGACKLFQTLVGSTLRPRYYFSGKSSQTLKDKLGASEQKMNRQKQVEFRKNLMQQMQLKNIRDQIQNTKQNFNPMTAYFKLYRSYFLGIFLVVGVCLVLLLFVYVGGVQRDVFTGQKKFVLVSEKYQKSIDQVIRKIIFLQLCGTDSPVQNLSTGLKQKVQQISGRLCQVTKRKYRIYTISAAEHVLVVLPQSIVISKNLLLEYSEEDVFNLMLLMEGLFVKRWHIKELALSNFKLFAQAKLMESSVADIKLTSIYSRKYSQKQIEAIVSEMSKCYHISQQVLKDRVSKALNGFKNRSYRQESPLCLANRFQEANIPVN